MGACRGTQRQGEHTQIAHETTLIVRQIVALTDTDAAWSKSIGLSLDLSAAGLGIRTTRYALILEDLVVKAIRVRPRSIYYPLSHHRTRSRRARAAYRRPVLSICLSYSSVVPLHGSVRRIEWAFICACVRAHAPHVIEFCLLIHRHDKVHNRNRVKRVSLHSSPSHIPPS